jgi:hypothetical protein
MRYDEDRDTTPESCRELQVKVNTLFWLKKAMAQLPDLPNGRLKEELEASIDALRMASEDFPSYKRNCERIEQLELENESLRTQISTLEVETCDSDPVMEDFHPPEISRITRRQGLIIVVFIVASFLLGRCGNGADLDLGGARRTPDASAVQPSYEERSTRDVGIPTAPGKS